MEEIIKNLRNFEKTFNIKKKLTIFLKNLTKYRKILTNFEKIGRIKKKLTKLIKKKKDLTKFKKREGTFFF